MASTKLQEYVEAATYAVEHENGELLAQLITLKHDDEYVDKGLADLATSVCASAASPPEAISAVALLLVQGHKPFRDVGGKYPEILEAHFNAILAICECDWPGAYAAQCTALTGLAAEAGRCSSAWLVAPLHAVVRDAYTLSLAAEAAVQQSGTQEAGTLTKELVMALRITASKINTRKVPKDEAHLGMGVGLLYVLNMWLKCVFKLGMVDQGRFIKIIRESSHFPAAEHFPLSQWVTFKYYTGRLAFIQGDMKEANTLLSFALKHCPASASQNLRLILKYLVPVRMTLGYLPHPSMLAKYNLRVYSQVADAMREGDLRTYREAMAKHQLEYIRSGVLLCMESLQLLVYRRLFMRTKLLLNHNNVPFRALSAAAAACGDDSSQEEVLCIMSRLISRGYLQGKLFLSEEMWVISSKAKPLAPLTKLLKLRSLR